jgi:hypothetical protein
LKNNVFQLVNRAPGEEEETAILRQDRAAASNVQEGGARKIKSQIGILSSIKICQPAMGAFTKRSLESIIRKCLSG